MAGFFISEYKSTAFRFAVNLMIAMRYLKFMTGCRLEASLLLVRDNMANVLNTTSPLSTIKEKHQACNYHKLSVYIAAEFIIFTNINSKNNLADISSKPS